jgi:hypothetical protein
LRPAAPRFLRVIPGLVAAAVFLLLAGDARPAWAAVVTLPSVPVLFVFLILLPFSILLLATLWLYSVYRHFRPSAPRHHKRFIWGAAVLPYIAFVVVPTVALSRHAFDGGWEYAKTAAVILVPWIICCLGGYAGYRRVMRLPEEQRLKKGTSLAGSVFGAACVSALLLSTNLFTAPQPAPMKLPRTIDDPNVFQPPK